MNNEPQNSEKELIALEKIISTGIQDSVPNLDSFSITKEELEYRSLSNIETTLSCFLHLFYKRNDHAHIKKKLLYYVDNLKVALLKLDKGKIKDKETQHKILQIAKKYNTFVEKAQTPPKPFFQKLKFFFLKCAGLLIDEEIQKSRIQISLPSKESIPIAAKIENLSISQHVSQEEKDLFYMKAYTLLQNHSLPDELIRDSLQAMKKEGINAHLHKDAKVILSHSFSPLPGENIEIVGLFQRGQAKSRPIKNSFQAYSRSKQTGYPHPLQSIGFALSDTLLPKELLRPHEVPLLSSFLEKKKNLAQELEPGTPLNKRAKELLSFRKRLFKTHRDTLLPLQKKFTHSLLLAAEQKPEEKIDSFFDSSSFETQSMLCHLAVHFFLLKPIQQLEQLWLNDKVHTKSDIEKELATFTQKTSPDSFLTLYGSALKKALPALSHLHFFERLFYPLPSFDLFPQKIVLYTFLELEGFIHELHHIECNEQAFLQWTKQVLEQRIELFENMSPIEHPLIEEIKKLQLRRQ